MKKLAIIEPFYKGSHKYWLDQILERSKADIKTLTKPGVHWKWRVQQSSLIFCAEELADRDIIFTTNMVNLAAWSGINRHHLKDKELYHYFHENQLTYPSENKYERSFYGFFDINNAVCADKVFFNSTYHKDVFLEAIEVLSKKLPEKLPSYLIDNIDSKSRVLPVGIDCQKIVGAKVTTTNKSPLILWNHRHEYDKNPELFFETLISFFKKGLDFRLVVLGAEAKNGPDIFHKAKELLKPVTLHWGYTNSFEEYCDWLWKADIAPVTSLHDFFGISVLEAALCENHLLLPKANAYPDHFPVEEFSDHYYHNAEDFASKLETLITEKNFQCHRSSQVPYQYDWPQVVDQFDSLFI